MGLVWEEEEEEEKGEVEECLGRWHCFFCGREEERKKGEVREEI